MGLIRSESWVGGAQKAHGIRKKGTDLQPLGAPAGGLQHALCPQLGGIHGLSPTLRHSTGFPAGKAGFWASCMHMYVCVCPYQDPHRWGRRLGSRLDSPLISWAQLPRLQTRAICPCPTCFKGCPQGPNGWKLPRKQKLTLRMSKPQKRPSTHGGESRQGAGSRNCG